MGSRATMSRLAFEAALVQELDRAGGDAGDVLGLGYILGALVTSLIISSSPFRVDRAQAIACTNEVCISAVEWTGPPRSWNNRPKAEAMRWAGWLATRTTTEAGEGISREQANSQTKTTAQFAHLRRNLVVRGLPASDRSRTLEMMASAAARSAAGSLMRRPPTTFRYTS